MKTAEVNRYLLDSTPSYAYSAYDGVESSSRAKKPHFQMRNDITTATLKAAKGLSKAT